MLNPTPSLLSLTSRIRTVPGGRVDEAGRLGDGVPRAAVEVRQALPFGRGQVEQLDLGQPVEVRHLAAVDRLLLARLRDGRQRLDELGVDVEARVPEVEADGQLRSP